MEKFFRASRRNQPLSILWIQNSSLQNSEKMEILSTTYDHLKMITIAKHEKRTLGEEEYW